MISFMIGVILLPFALIAATVSFLLIVPIFTITIYIPWFIITHGWAEFKVKYMEDNDDAKGKGKTKSKTRQGLTP